MNVYQWPNEKVNLRKRFFGKTCGNVVRGRGACENLVRLSMDDGTMETVKYM